MTRLGALLPRSSHTCSAILNSGDGTEEGRLATPEDGKPRERVDGGNGQKTQVGEVAFRTLTSRSCVEHAFSFSVRVALFSSEF